jgi:hypothetical protein
VQAFSSINLTINFALQLLGLMRQSARGEESASICIALSPAYRCLASTNAWSADLRWHIALDRNDIEKKLVPVAAIRRARKCNAARPSPAAR